MDKVDSQQLVEDLRQSLEQCKKDYDRSQDENYSLVKKNNQLKDECDNRDTQLRRLNAKILTLNEEIAKLRSQRVKEKEMSGFRRQENQKLIKIAVGIGNSANSLILEGLNAIEEIFDNLK